LNNDFLVTKVAWVRVPLCSQNLYFFTFLVPFWYFDVGGFLGMDRVLSESLWSMMDLVF
ncbi:hypothetical protein BGZ60DRAFT_406988, partial [Tricladium varicosporioides]